MPIEIANKDLLVTTSFRNILSIALPICLALLVPQLNFIINNIFIGGLGEEALGTAGITGVFYLVFALVGNGLNNGLQVLISRNAGEGNIAEIGKWFGQSARVSILLSIACAVLVWFFGPVILSMVLKSEQVASSAASFLKIRVIGLPFLYLFQLANAFLVSTSNSRYLKYAFLIQALVNIILDYSLIFGHFGVNAMGFNGAAVASVIAEIAAAGFVFTIILRKKFHARFNLFKYLQFDKRRALLFFKTSTPLVLQYLLSIVAWLLFYILIENRGEHSLAISSAMRNIFGLFGVFAWGFASTCNTMVSNLIGQRRENDVIKLVWRIMLLSSGLTAICCLALNLFPAEFLGLFIKDKIFINDGTDVLRIVSAGVLCGSAATVWLNAVSGTGKTIINLVIELITISVYTFYIVMALRVWNISLAGAWASELLYWSILLLLSMLYMLRGRWKTVRISVS